LFVFVLRREFSYIWKLYPFIFLFVFESLGSTAMMTECTSLQFVSPFAFEAMQKVDVVRLASLSDPELRLLLPCLVRMALCAPADQSQSWAQDKKLILRLLSGVEAVNSIVALLSVDFHALEQDASKEQQLR
jgi:integrator complex subunit 2